MNDFLEWVSAILGPSYRYSIGDWVETKATASAFYCAIRGDGGSRPDAGDRRARYSVVLLGRREQRGDAEIVLNGAQSLMQASFDGPYPCGVANISATGEPVGPSATTENRAWVKLVFEVTT